MRNEINEENTSRHEEVLKLIPENSVYMLLWGEPLDDKQFKMRALGNLAAEGRMRILLSYIKAEIDDDKSGVMAQMFQNALAERLESMIGELVIERMAGETPHGGN